MDILHEDMLVAITILPALQFRETVLRRRELSEFPSNYNHSPQPSIHSGFCTVTITVFKKICHEIETGSSMTDQLWLSKGGGITFTNKLEVIKGSAASLLRTCNLCDLWPSPAYCWSPHMNKTPHKIQDEEKPSTTNSAVLKRKGRLSSCS